MVEMHLSAVPFGDVKHTEDAILRERKQQLARYGVGQFWNTSFTASGTEIVLLDTVLQSVHMKVTDNASNIKKAFTFFEGGFCFLHTLELVITSRCCGTPCERLQFPNIILKDRRLQFGSWTLSILT
jgi:hypothetical protein